MGVDAIKRWWIARDEKIKGVKTVFMLVSERLLYILAGIEICLQLLSKSFAEKCIPFKIVHYVSVIFILNLMFKDIFKILHNLCQNENSLQVVAKLVFKCFQEFWV